MLGGVLIKRTIDGPGNVCTQLCQLSLLKTLGHLPYRVDPKHERVDLELLFLAIDHAVKSSNLPLVLRKGPLAPFQ